MSTMVTGRYVGPIRPLTGETALLKRKDQKILLAQFDNTKLPKQFTHGWTEIPKKHFEVDGPLPDLIRSE